MLARKKRKKTEPPSGPSSNRQLSIEPEYDNPHVVNLNPARNGKFGVFFDHRKNPLKIHPEIDLTWRMIIYRRYLPLQRVHSRARFISPKMTSRLRLRMKWWKSWINSKSKRNLILMTAHRRRYPQYRTIGLRVVRWSRLYQKRQSQLIILPQW